MKEYLTGRPGIRAVFIDIDGTLIGGSELVSPAVREAITEARRRGCAVILCTGRTRYRAWHIVESVGQPIGYLVASNGSVVTHHETAAVLSRKLLPRDSALEVVNAIIEHGAEPFVFEDSDRPGIEGSRVLYHPDLPVGEWADFPRYRPYADITCALPFDPISVGAFGPAAKMRPLRESLRDMLPDLSMIQSGSENHWGVEVYVENVSKRAGAERVAAALGLDKTEIAAIGDHINDIELINWAQVGIAMGNAVPEVLAAADWITTSVYEDGVARALEKYVL